jgi:hypothetical protein
VLRYVQPIPPPVSKPQPDVLSLPPTHGGFDVIANHLSSRTSAIEQTSGQQGATKMGIHDDELRAWIVTMAGRATGAR